MIWDDGGTDTDPSGWFRSCLCGMRCALFVQKVLVRSGHPSVLCWDCQ